MNTLPSPDMTDLSLHLLWPTGASPLILRCLNILVPETQQRPRPPPPDVVTAAKTLRQIRSVFPPPPPDYSTSSV